MKIHTNTIEETDLHSVLPKGCHLQATEKGSRSHRRAYDVAITADTGKDRHGIDRRANKATYIEYGDWLAEVFLLDHDAKAGHYEGAADFVEKTQKQAASRQERENAQVHADRWQEQIEEATASYKIIRQCWDSNHPDHLRTIRRGLTLDEAQEHCQRDDTHEIGPDGIAVWFDGYTRDN